MPALSRLRSGPIESMLIGKRKIARPLLSVRAEASARLHLADAKKPPLVRGLFSFLGGLFPVVAPVLDPLQKGGVIESLCKLGSLFYGFILLQKHALRFDALGNSV